MLRPRSESRDALLWTIRHWRTLALKEFSRRRTAEQRLLNARCRGLCLQKQLDVVEERTMLLEIEYAIATAEISVHGCGTQQTLTNGDIEKQSTDESDNIYLSSEPSNDSD